MGNLYYPAEVTELKDTGDWFRAMGDAWKRIVQQPAPDQSLRLLCAQWMLETGKGKMMYCYNIGNLHARGASHPWKGGVTFYQGDEGAAKTFDFTPDKLWNRWRAYPVFQDGIDDYLRLKYYSYRHAWSALLQGDPEAYALALHSNPKKMYSQTPPKEYAARLKGVLRDVPTTAIPPAQRVELKRLVPDGCDPTSNPDYVPELFHPYPPRGKDAWKKAFGKDETTCYAYRIGFKGDEASIKPDVRGFSCSRLLIEPISTVFSGDKFRHFNWDTMSYKTKEYSLAELGLPTAFTKIDAACVNPIDWDIVWLFSGKRVLDFSVTRQRPLRRGRVVDGKIVEEVDVEIKDHPVFGVLPPEAQDGVRAVFLAPTMPMSAETPQGAPERSRKYPLTANKNERAQTDPTRDASRWLYVVAKGQRPWMGALVVTSVNRAWLQPQQFYQLSEADITVNGAGKKSNFLHHFDKSGKCTAVRGHSTTDLVRKDVAWPTGFIPDSAAQRPILPPPAAVAAVAPRKKDDASSPTAPANTIKHPSIEPPDSLMVVVERGITPVTSDATIAFLEGLAGCRDGDPSLDADLRARSDALVRRVNESVDIPDFLRFFLPVRVKKTLADGNKPIGYEAVYYVSPDWLSIGSDFEWCRVPLSAVAGQRVLNRFGCRHPTPLMARQIYESTRAPTGPVDPFVPFISRESFKAVEGGVQSTEMFLALHQDIEFRRRDSTLGHLITGPMRDVTIGKVVSDKKQLLLWGGVLASGKAAENKGAHDLDRFTDHAMGLRLVYGMLYIKKAGGAWAPKSIDEVLSNDVEYALISDERGVSPRYPEASG